MNSILVYLNMGGFAAYVWPAYGVCTGVMIWLIIASYMGLIRERRILEQLGKKRVSNENVSDVGPVETSDDA